MKDKPGIIKVTFPVNHHRKSYQWQSQNWSTTVP